MMDFGKKIFIAGAYGMVGRAICDCLQKNGYRHLLIPSKDSLDATDQRAVRSFFKKNKPEIVIIAAAKVGGIYANMTYPAEFLYQNLMIECNLIHEAHEAGVDRLLFLGSTCIYPKMAAQPICESALLSGPLETTNEAYALAKISGIKMCTYYHRQYGRDYISAMPTNLYGPNDNYHPQNSHVIPGLIRRFHEAKINNCADVSIWGSGKPKREFLYVEDLAEACLFLLKHYHEAEHINVGSEEEFTIRQTAEIIAHTIGFEGQITFDLSKPDGTPRKKTDLSKLNALGWKAQTPFLTGIKNAYEDFQRKFEREKIAEPAFR